ncbi:MAG: hypothetical protein N3F66_05200 [Spirochaetes bacterium]|nr:hypothetical protein [Spirochaetota bacterium]
MREVDIIERVIRNIAHEVRNPLTTIKGYAQLLSHKSDPSLINKSQRMIIEQTERIDSIFTELYDAFTVPDDEISKCSFPELFQVVVEESPYNKYIVIDSTDQFTISLYRHRFQSCITTLINGFNWKYFDSMTVHLSAKKEMNCYVNIRFWGVVFESIPEEMFFYPFQCKQFFARGTELYKVYCIAQRCGWKFTFSKDSSEFTFIIPIQ